jgi:hypothetical protein
VRKQCLRMVDTLTVTTTDVHDEMTVYLMLGDLGTCTFFLVSSLTWEGFVEKCEEAKHSPPWRAAEDAPVTAQHDVPRWARGR